MTPVFFIFTFQFIIDCNEVMTIQTTIIVGEKHSLEAGDTQAAIQQAVTDWLTKELYK